MDEKDMWDAGGVALIARIGQSSKPSLVVQSLVLAKQNVSRLDLGIDDLTDRDDRMRRGNFQIMTSRLHKRSPAALERPLPPLDEFFKSEIDRPLNNPPTIILRACDVKNRFALDKNSRRFVSRLEGGRDHRSERDRHLIEKKGF